MLADSAGDHVRDDSRVTKYTPNHTELDMNILAIDLGKFSSMCCFFDTNTQEYRFQAVATNRRYLTAVLTNHKIDLVVMEACGPSGWISDLCQDQ